MDPALPEDIHALYLPGGFPAHVFHHSVVEPDLPLKTRFEVTKGGERYREGYTYKNVLAGYPHLYLYDRPALAERLFL